MAAESLVEKKFEASREIADALARSGAPILAAFWDFKEDLDRWTFFIVPTSPAEQLQMIKQSTELLVKPPYQSIFSLSDTAVDSQQVERAKALGAYFRYEPFVGRRIDTTFTGGQFFEAAVPVYFKPELMTHLSVAS